MGTTIVGTPNIYFEMDLETLFFGRKQNAFLHVFVGIITLLLVVFFLHLDLGPTLLKLGKWKIEAIQMEMLLLMATRNPVNSPVEVGRWNPII